MKKFSCLKCFLWKNTFQWACVGNLESGIFVTKLVLKTTFSLFKNLYLEVKIKAMNMEIAFQFEVRRKNKGKLLQPFYFRYRYLGEGGGGG